MEKRLHELEQKVDELARAVEQLRAKLEGPPPAVAPSSALLPEAPLAPLDASAARPIAPLIGRSLLAVAGAFVCRLATERALLPWVAGVALGLAFAAVWIFLASRAAKLGLRLSAGFHAGTAGLIGFSLLLETGGRLGQGGPPLLAAFTALLLAVAWQHRLQEVGWLAQLGCLATAAGLLRGAGSPFALLLVLLALAAGSLVLAQGRQWPHLRWPVALFLDFALLRLVFSLSAEGDAGRLTPVVLVAQVTVLLYLAALALGTWARRSPARTFEVVQTVLVLALGLVATGKAHGDAGPAGVLGAAGAIATAVHLARVPDRQFDSWFFGVLGVCLVIASGPLLATGQTLGVFWAALGLAFAGVGRWRLRGLLWGAAVALTWISTVPGGTLGLLQSGLARSPEAEWAAVTAAAAATVALALAGWGVMTVGLRPAQEWAPRALAAGLLVLGVLGAVALCSYGVREVLGGASGSPAGVIVGRTLLLGAVAVGLAGLRRLGGTIELGWGSWTLLGLCGLKVLLQDLPGGNAGSLVVAFLVLGLAILAIPRLLAGKPRG